MSHAIRPRPVTVAEFDAFVEGQPEEMKWELVNGEIVAMTNPNERHSEIVANIGMALRPVATRHGCLTSFGGMGVQAQAAGINKTIPDITVHCSERDPLRTHVTNPVVIVEVLSRSTMDYDRGGKLEFYKSLRSLRDIVIVYQDQVRIEHYRDGDAWTMDALTGPDATLRLTGLDAAVPVAAIYAGTGLLAD